MDLLQWSFVLNVILLGLLAGTLINNIRENKEQKEENKKVVGEVTEDERKTAKRLMQEEKALKFLIDDLVEKRIKFKIKSYNYSEKIKNKYDIDGSIEINTDSGKIKK